MMELKETGEYTLMWVGDDYFLMNPKMLIGMTKEKAEGSLKWSRSILPRCRCFVYDPSEISLFNEDGSPNKEVIDNLLENSK
jgi:hypothetical protein